MIIPATSMLVPAEGLIEMFSIDPDPTMVLFARGGRGVVCTVELARDGEDVGKAYVMHPQTFLDLDGLGKPDERENVRARAAVVHLTGAHFMFKGPVLIAGLSEERITELHEVIT